MCPPHWRAVFLPASPNSSCWTCMALVLIASGEFPTLVVCWTCGPRKNNLGHKVRAFTSGVDHRKNYSRRCPNWMNLTDVGHWPARLRRTCMLRPLLYFPIRVFGLNLDFRADKPLLLWAVRSLIREP